MKKEEVIEQLESLKYHCEDMIDKNDPEDIWYRDAIALGFAIKTLKRDLPAPQQK